jgi:hypothetical protein
MVISRSDFTQGHAFISYMREDAADVTKLQQALESAGVRVWRDKDDLWPGDDWKIKIRQAIAEGSLTFLACFSENTERRQSSYQFEELSLAVEQMRQRPPGQTWLIPVRFSDCKVPDYDLGNNRTLASLHWVDLFGERSNRELARLISVVIRRLAIPISPMVQDSEIPQAMSVTASELSNLISVMGRGDEVFRKVPVSSISFIAARMVQEVNTLRILGTAGQDLQDADNSVRRYLGETENRVRHGRPPFHYYRITSNRLRELFIGHLLLMLESGSKAHHDIQVQIIPNIEAAVTYQIFDDTDVLVLLGIPYPPGRRDYRVALMSSNRDIVMAFTEHFDYAWSQGEPVRDPQTFSRNIRRIN